jgi:hypothetical protein
MNRLDLGWADPAAAADQARAAADPVLDILGMEGCRADPGSSRRVPLLTAIGINHDRLSSGFAGDADQRVRLGRIDAVDSHGDDLVDIAGEREGLGHRFSRARTIADAGHRQPARVFAASNLSQQCLDLGKARNRFEGEDVDIRFSEQLNSWPMPLA